jgi:hypothetical protein
MASACSSWPHAARVQRHRRARLRRGRRPMRRPRMLTHTERHMESEGAAAVGVRRRWGRPGPAGRGWWPVPRAERDHYQGDHGDPAVAGERGDRRNTPTRSRCRPRGWWPTTGLRLRLVGRARGPRPTARSRGTSCLPSLLSLRLNETPRSCDLCAPPA